MICSFLAYTIPIPENSHMIFMKILKKNKKVTWNSCHEWQTPKYFWFLNAFNFYLSSVYTVHIRIKYVMCLFVPSKVTGLWFFFSSDLSLNNASLIVRRKEDMSIINYIKTVMVSLMTIGTGIMKKTEGICWIFYKSKTLIW